MIDDISDLHPSPNLSADDLLGEPQTVTIKSVENGEAVGIEGKKSIIRFEGIPKPMVSNTTNDYTIAILLGRKPSGWAGKKIVIAPSTSTYAGKAVPCIRVTDSPDAPAAKRKIVAEIRASIPDEKTKALAEAIKIALATTDPRKGK
jgi:hypothetical protein